MSASRLVSAGLAAFLVACGIAGPAMAQVEPEPGATSGGSVLKTGWWWKVNETPLDDTAVSPPQPSAPNVPKGSLPVSAVNGEPEKLSAIEFKIAAKKGSLATSFVMALRESDEPGTNTNHEQAKVAACPVTDIFWADGQAAKWQARPTYDCDFAMALGKRGKDGVWRFDLTSMAGLWLSPTNTGSPSVVLVEQGEAPESFQVVYDGQKANGIGLKIRTTAPPKNTPAPAPAPGPTEAGGDGSAGTTPPVAGGGGGSVPTTPGSVSGTLTGAPGGAGPVDAPVGAPLDAPIAGAPVGAPAGAPIDAPVDAPVAGAPAESAPQAAPATGTQLTSTTAAGPPPWYAGIPRAGLLLVPFVLGLAYLMMMALGPDAQPATATTQHGVGRALDRLRRMSAQVSAKGLRR